jgi:hypothetical protein
MKGTSCKGELAAGVSLSILATEIQSTKSEERRTKDE